MNQVKIGQFIAELRHENHMTQELLGQNIGVTNKTISRWENGNYMPDVEMLQILSRQFHVSINELLSGERLDDSSFRQAADTNLVAALNSKTFSYKERTAYWKKKWLKEHEALIIICSVISIAVIALAWSASVYWLIGVCPLGWLVMYALLRNRMMIYVEDRVFTMTSESSNSNLHTK